MTYLDAANQILKRAGESLHYAEITKRALDEGLIAPTGLTPDATMGSRLYTETKQEGSRFVRAGRGVFGLVQWQPSGIDAQVQAINEKTRSQLHEFLHTMPAERFEALVMELLLQMGFDESSVEVTPYGGDGGIDVVGVYRAAGLTEVNAAVQAKRWKGNVRAPTVTQLRGSLQVHQQGILITTSDFSKGAYQEAIAQNKTRIGLINGDELVNLLMKYRVGVVEKTLTVVSLDDEWWGEWGSPAVESNDEKEQPIIPSPNSLRPEAVEVTSAKKHLKPNSFDLFGERYQVTAWKEIVVGVSEVLAKSHPIDFAEKTTTIRGRTRQYVAPSGEGMINGEPIPGTDLWVETNLSGPDSIKLSRRLLAACGYEANSLTVDVQEQ